MKNISRRLIALLASLVLAMQMFAGPAIAYADDGTTNAADQEQVDQVLSSLDVTVSSEGDAAVVGDASFALDGFSRAQKGSNAASEDAEGNEVYVGYKYYVSGSAGSTVAIGMTGYTVVYVPTASLSTFGISLTDQTCQNQLKSLFVGLDTQNASGGNIFSMDDEWLFTDQTEFTTHGITFKFDQELKNGQFYACIIGADGSDITDNSNPLFDKPNHADSAVLASPSEVNIATEATGLDSIVNFLTTLNWSPLWVTLKTTGVAIVFIFVLGLAAAYFTLHISPKAQNIFDSIFTIPMVLPPTVCGFVLLFLCGSKTPFGQFFIDIGFPLIFSWPATVIAATVVAFPLMYRNSRGAFENLDPNMLDAARTLGWSNARIFFKLMLPLSWSSIAAATVLAFARALGEFGATLFLAGNYLGVTRTIPIAIYFEWMNGNDAVAWFWTAIIIVFSFIVILFINLWSNHTTRYRKGSEE